MKKNLTLEQLISPEYIAELNRENFDVENEEKVREFMKVFSEQVSKLKQADHNISDFRSLYFDSMVGDLLLEYQKCSGYAWGQMQLELRAKGILWAMKVKKIINENPSKVKEVALNINKALPHVDPDEFGAYVLEPLMILLPVKESVTIYNSLDNLPSTYKESDNKWIKYFDKIDKGCSPILNNFYSMQRMGSRFDSDLEKAKSIRKPAALRTKAKETAAR